MCVFVCARSERHEGRKKWKEKIEGRINDKDKMDGEVWSWGRGAGDEGKVTWKKCRNSS